MDDSQAKTQGLAAARRTPHGRLQKCIGLEDGYGWGDFAHVRELTQAPGFYEAPGFYDQVGAITELIKENARNQMRLERVKLGVLILTLTVVWIAIYTRLST